jgi:hypothetical protein
MSEKASSFSAEKAAKRLSLPRSFATRRRNPIHVQLHQEQKFFGSFFQKRTKIFCWSPLNAQ